jgi:hypothetical protein
VTIIPLAFGIPFYWGIVTAAGSPLPSSITCFISAVEETASQISGFKKHVGTSPLL